jgi:hypothetical protein
LEPARPGAATQTAESTGDQWPASETNDDRPTRPEGSGVGFSLSRVLVGMAANVGLTGPVIVLIVWLRKLANRFVHFGGQTQFQ